MAKTKKPFIIGEKLILPAAKDVCCELLGETAVQKMTCAPLSASTRASLVARMVKNLPAMQKSWVWSLGGEDPLEKGMAIHSSFLAGESHGQRSLAGSQRVVHDWATNTLLHGVPPRWHPAILAFWYSYLWAILLPLAWAGFSGLLLAIHQTVAEGTRHHFRG